MTDTDKTYVSIKTEELEGRVLRYAVAVAADVPVNFDGEKLWVPWGTKAPGCNPYGQTCWRPDRDWSQLGPLIERFGVAFHVEESNGNVAAWTKAGRQGPMVFGCKSHRLAACRAIAAAHHGDYADVPRELVQGQKATT